MVIQQAFWHKYLCTISPLPPYIHHAQWHHPPVSFLVFFSLSEWSCNMELSYYATYLFALNFPNNEKFINIPVHKFIMSTDALYPDDSSIFMVVKAALLSGPLQKDFHYTTPLSLLTPCSLLEQSALLTIVDPLNPSL